MWFALATTACALGHDLETFPWAALRFQHLARLRTHWQTAFAPATANKHLAAVCGVLRQAWLLELVDAEAYHRAAAIPSVKGQWLPTGHALEAGELRALFVACADGTPTGARDATGLALLPGCELRRTEAVTVTRADYAPTGGQCRVLGKGNKQCTVYAPPAVGLPSRPGGPCATPARARSSHRSPRVASSGPELPCPSRPVSAAVPP